MFDELNAGTMLAKIKHGREIFMVTWEAPREAAAGNIPLHAMTQPKKIVINLDYEGI